MAVFYSVSFFIDAFVLKIPESQQLVSIENLPTLRSDRTICLGHHGFIVKQLLKKSAKFDKWYYYCFASRLFLHSKANRPTGNSCVRIPIRWPKTILISGVDCTRALNEFYNKSTRYRWKIDIEPAFEFVIISSLTPAIFIKIDWNILLCCDILKTSTITNFPNFEMKHSRQEICAISYSNEYKRGVRNERGIRNSCLLISCFGDNFVSKSTVGYSMREFRSSRQ